MSTAAFSVRIVVALLVLASGGCAAGSGGARAGTPVPTTDSALTEAEMAPFEALDLYTVVQRLRGQWLQSRGIASVRGGVTEVVVFLDDQRQSGGPDVLRSLRVREIQEVRYMNARDATTRWGTDMTGGVIEVVTKR